jgi:molybdenum cofactor biosynthesis protein B
MSSTTGRNEKGDTSGVAQHRAEAPKSLRLAVVTISDTRTLATDTSGALIVELAEGAGHVIAAREIIPDEPDRMRPLLETYRDRGDLHAALLTGGTGISPRDQTYETVSALLTKPLPGYGELFRMLSYAEIGPAAMLSRAVGGLAGGLVVLVMPGSRAAVRLAMEKLILPELPHLVREARKGT